MGLVFGNRFREVCVVRLFECRSNLLVSIGLVLVLYVVLLDSFIVYYIVYYIVVQISTLNEILLYKNGKQILNRSCLSIIIKRGTLLI